MKENAPIVKKASKFIGSVAEAYQSPEPRGTVKVSDLDDIEGVKNRQKKWEEGQVSHAEGIKQPADGYKVDETEEIKARRQKWEEGGQGLSRAESIKQPVDGYKVDETEELKARRQKWEGGQMIGAEGTRNVAPEGYKLSDSVGVKDRLSKWSEVAAVPSIKSERGRPVPLVEATEENPSAEHNTPGTKDRLKQWQDGSVGVRENAEKSPVKVSDEDVAAVKERLTKWGEVTKEPEQSSTRKEPLKIYDDNENQ